MDCGATTTAALSKASPSRSRPRAQATTLDLEALDRVDLVPTELALDSGSPSGHRDRSSAWDLSSAPLARGDVLLP